MLFTAMLTLASMSGPALAARTETDAIRWDWSQPQRYALETTIRLPEMMWLATRYNKQARVDAMDVRVVAQCGPGERATRKKFEVSCTLEDVGFSAEALPQEAGLVGEIVKEFDERMTGAAVQLQVRSDGRLINVDLEDVERRNQRFARINENLRLILSRVFSGLDLPLPREGQEDGWIQHSSWIMRAPAVGGSAGTSTITHKVTALTATTLTVTSAGSGIIVPDPGINKYRARMVSETSFDRRQGRILDRTWTLLGGPTASSAVAQGFEGYPYMIQGRVVFLPDGQSWDVGESRELEQSSLGKSALQQSFMGPQP